VLLVLNSIVAAFALGGTYLRGAGDGNSVCLAVSVGSCSDLSGVGCRAKAVVFGVGRGVGAGAKVSTYDGSLERSEVVETNTFVGGVGGITIGWGAGGGDPWPASNVNGKAMLTAVVTIKATTPNVKFRLFHLSSLASLLPLLFLKKKIGRMDPAFLLDHDATEEGSS